MRIVIILTALALGRLSWGAEEQPEPLVKQLIGAYTEIQTMRCDIRKEIEIDGTLETSLSRVWFERPDHLRVDAVSPQPRGILVDGTHIYKWVEGEDHGVKIPLTEAARGEQIQIRRVPATGQEYLLHIEDCPETLLPPQPGLPVRRGYTQPAPFPFTVISMTPAGRLGRIELFASPAQTNRLLKVDYSEWQEVADTIWIPCLQETTGYRRTGSTVLETMRVGAIVINQPIAARQFDPNVWAKDVTFVNQEAMADLLNIEESGR